MIFRPGLVRLIAAGKKTATRRVVKPGEERCAYRIGRSYAVQIGRGKPAVLRVVIAAVEPQRLGDLTYDDARAEGYRTRADLAHTWMVSHDQGYTDDDRDDDDTATLTRWERRHGDTPVWAITFTLDTAESVRLLHRRSEHGYTTRREDALSDEPEGVDAQTLDAFAADNRARHTAARPDDELARRARTLGRRVREETLATSRAGIDVTTELDRITRELDAIVTKRKAA